MSDLSFIPDNPYILLTPGPLSTSKGVRNAMLRDWCTWDDDYNADIVQNIRERLTAIATKDTANYTTVLMQGSGSFTVEATLGTAVPADGKILIITNGAYGDRMVQMAKVLKLNFVEYALTETDPPCPQKLDEMLKADPAITHVSLVHCETTTGMLNPLKEIAEVSKKNGKIFIADAMSSFGGIPMDVSELQIDYLVSSSNKCVQGVPGFAFAVIKTDVLKATKGNARSLCMDLYDQWEPMNKSGKWRYTSATHVVRAFYQALDELEQEGGITARHARYAENQKILVEGMAELGLESLLPRELQSPIISSFLYPNADFDFMDFYEKAKARGFVLYPGKISNADTFRIGNIGEVYPDDIRRLLEVIREIRNW
ncbi:MAG: 2-aminoethylphosphonate--pyruvate transaminase [Defluviitaleaceae bacterium]|nr:2-aminoethylphosphonate--pyruvate transaminase [Defluviitaleaceae bacterium]